MGTRSNSDLTQELCVSLLCSSCWLLPSLPSASSTSRPSGPSVPRAPTRIMRRPLEDCDCLGDLIKCAPDCTVEDADEVECDADDEADCEEVYGEGCKHCKCGDASTMYVSIGAVMAAVAVALF